ncbi:hypothetical protein U0070_011417 [Myodes glareolus]|uniref:Uncharacterized protein n=1 Tax=Myodes glareolus TaxID=447135 RepID=A0AAW0HYG0_MYOGA
MHDSRTCQLFRGADPIGLSDTACKNCPCGAVALQKLVKGKEGAGVTSVPDCPSLSPSSQETHYSVPSR